MKLITVFNQAQKFQTKTPPVQMDNLAFEHNTFFDFGAWDDQRYDVTLGKSIPGFNKHTTFTDVLGQAGIVSVLAGKNGGPAERFSGRFS